MKIADCFMYFNEKDIAYLRIKELYDSVDYFVINEATTTHLGNEQRELLFWKDERLNEFKDKIHYKPINLMRNYGEFTSKLFPEWKMRLGEQEQRARLHEGLYELNLNEDDFVFISDCDEIPNKNSFQTLSQHQLVAFNQMFFVHYINVYTNKNVTGTVACRFGKMKHINNQYNNLALEVLRANKDFVPRIENGGWHYSYMGGAKTVSKKVTAIPDGNLESPWKTEESSQKLIEESIKNRKSPFSTEPLDIIDLDTKFLNLNFITAILGRWERHTAVYEAYPKVLENNGKNEFKDLIYTNE